MDPNKVNDRSEQIKAGTLFNRILKLEPKISEAILALEQGAREEIMALESDAKAFEAAVAKLLAPKAQPETTAPAAQKGSKT